MKGRTGGRSPGADRYSRGGRPKAGGLRPEEEAAGDCDGHCTKARSPCGCHGHCAGGPAAPRAERERRTCRPMLDAERPPAVAVAARRALVMERAADDRKRRPAAEVPFM